MALGYEGLVSINTTPILCTSFSAPQSRVKMESNSAYKGTMETEMDPGLFYPRTYDYPLVDGSLSFELSEDSLSLLIGFIEARGDSFAVASINRMGAAINMNECYWNSISFSISEGQIVVVNLDFIAKQMNTYTIGGSDSTNNYADNRLGVSDEYPSATEILGLPILPTTLAADLNINPYPWWKFTVYNGENITKYLTWSLSFSQDIVRHFLCKADTDVYAPSIFSIGPLSVNFKFDILPDYNISPFATVENPIAALEVRIDGVEAFTLEDLELQRTVDDIQSFDSLSVVSLSYDVYQITFPE